jgi:hypothetical protein
VRHTGALQFGFLQVISLTCFLFLCLSAFSEPYSSVDSAHIYFHYRIFPNANTRANFTPQNFTKFLPLNTTANYSTTTSDTFSLYANHELCTSAVSDTTPILQQHSQQTTNTTTNNTSISLIKNKNSPNSTPTQEQTAYKHQQHNPKLTYHTHTRELRQPPAAGSTTPTRPTNLGTLCRTNLGPMAEMHNTWGIAHLHHLQQLNYRVATKTKT